MRVARDVVYATRGGQPLHLDVAWSNAGAPGPLVLLLHGGGWSGGSRASLEGEMQALARLGYTAATLLELPGVGHGFFGMAASREATVRCAVREFLAPWLRQRVRWPAGLGGLMLPA